MASVNTRKFKSIKKISLKQSRRYDPFALRLDEEKKAFADTSGFTDGLRVFGNIMFILAGFFLLGTIFAYFGLWALESIFYSLVFSGNGFIVGVLGFFLFLIIFIIVFIAYAVVAWGLGGALNGLIACGISAAVGGLCYLIAMSMEP